MSDLLSINVNEHTEKKGGLTYLSWAWAWAEVLKRDKAARYEVRTFGPNEAKQPVCWIGDTAIVCVEVVVDGVCRECWLPVMDNKNNAVKNPDARKISDAIMRCMTKAVALHGLGLYIYAGEDLPQGDPGAADAQDARRAELDEIALYLIDCHQNEADMKAIAMWYDPKTWRADNPTEQEEKLYVWGLLKAHSKLRAAIKANNPNNKEAA